MPFPQHPHPRIAFDQPPAGRGRDVAEGFAPLYSGADLSGWKTDPGHAGHWQPKDWVLSYDGRSEAATRTCGRKKSTATFVLICDWRWTRKPVPTLRPVLLPSGEQAVDADGQPQQVEVPRRGRQRDLPARQQQESNQYLVLAGGLGRSVRIPHGPQYAGGSPRRRNARKCADKPIGQWNRFLITMRGDQLTVELNGETVIENASTCQVCPRAARWRCNTTATRSTLPTSSSRSSIHRSRAGSAPKAEDAEPEDVERSRRRERTGRGVQAGKLGQKNEHSLQAPIPPPRSFMPDIGLLDPPHLISRGEPAHEHAVVCFLVVGDLHVLCIPDQLSAGVVRATSPRIKVSVKGQAYSKFDMAWPPSMIACVQLPTWPLPGLRGDTLGGLGVACITASGAILGL
jgi:hypothetical protein